jgi:uncharacterized protein
MYVSWIHEVDFCRAVSLLLEREELEGAVNLASPEPLPNAEFMAALRSAMGRKFGLPLPAPLVRFGAWARGTETELVLKSRRVVPGRLLEAGFEFRYPSWEEAVQDLLRSSNF